MVSLDLYEEIVKRNKQIVTIFMLTHKRPNYLKLAIQSVLSQTYDNFLLIVLDNMSGDTTMQVVSSFDDSRVVYVQHDGKSPDGNFRYAFSITKAKYTIIMHDDDIYERDYLQQMIKTIESNNNIVALSPTATIINSEGDVVREGEKGQLITFKNNEYLIERYLKQSPGMVFPAVLYRTSFFENINEFMIKEAGPAADQFLHFEVGRRGGTLAILKTPLIQYRVHENQDSHLRGTDMDFILLNYLSSIPYYKDILIQNKHLLPFFVKKTLILSIKHFLKTRDKNKNKDNYKKIPKVCIETAKGRFLKFVFLMFVLFPRTFTHFYFVKRGNICERKKQN